MKRFIILALAFILFSCTSLQSKNKPISLAQKFELSENSILIKVQGMVCDYCVNGLKEEFGPKKSVVSVEVNLESENMLIILKQGQLLSDIEIKNSVAIRGLEAISITRK